MRDPIVFMKIGNVLVNVAHIVSVEFRREERIGECVIKSGCDIVTDNGKTYFYVGSKEDFLNELNALMERAR